MFVSSRRKLELRAAVLAKEAAEILAPPDRVNLKGESIPRYMSAIDFGYLVAMGNKIRDTKDTFARCHMRFRRRYAQNCFSRARALRKLLKYYVERPGDPDFVDSKPPRRSF